MQKLAAFIFFMILPFLSHSNKYLLLENGRIVLLKVNLDTFDTLENQLNNKEVRMPKEFYDNRSRFDFIETITNRPISGQYYGPFRSYLDTYTIYKFCIENSKVEFGYSVFYSKDKNLYYAFISTSNHEDENFGNGVVESNFLRRNEDTYLICSLHNHPFENFDYKSYPSGCFRNCSCYTQDDCLYFQVLKSAFPDRVIGLFYMIDQSSNTLFGFGRNHCIEVTENNVNERILKEIYNKVSILNKN